MKNLTNTQKMKGKGYETSWVQIIKKVTHTHTHTHHIIFLLHLKAAVCHTYMIHFHPSLQFYSTEVCVFAFTIDGELEEFTHK